MRLTIKPSRAVGTVIAPPSKSMAHRCLICAGLSRGESVVRNLAMSKDIEATVGCLRSLGADIRIEGDTAYILGVDPRIAPEGAPTLYCNESGSTLRFMIPLCMLSGSEYVLEGAKYLFTRPLSVYEDLAAERGLKLSKTADSVTAAGKLKSGVYTVPGNISSQFISGLLFALPLLDGDSELRVTEPVESFPYIDMTIDALRTFGIEIIYPLNSEKGYYSYTVRGGQQYRACDVTVEGDYSNAAFFDALNYAGSDVKVEGLRKETLQGDSAYSVLFEWLKSRGDELDISDCPDLGPVLFAVAALTGGGRFSGTKRLRIKESDRAAAMQTELKKFGIEMTVEENHVVVHRGVLHEPTEPLCGHGDHRIVMAMAVLTTVTGGVIDGAEAVEKSFPDFFEKLKQLGVNIE